MKKNANERIIENNFYILEKAVASTARKEESGLALIKEAVKELRLYLPNVEEKIREYFVYGCTSTGRSFTYSKTNLYNKKVKEAYASIDWEHIY